MTKYVLIKTTDFYNYDNINGKIQTEIHNTYDEAYDMMKTELLNHIASENSEIKQAVLQHIEFTNVFLDKFTARYHAEGLNYYWKIIAITDNISKGELK